MFVIILPLNLMRSQILLIFPCDFAFSRRGQEVVVRSMLIRRDRVRKTAKVVHHADMACLINSIRALASDQAEFIQLCHIKDYMRLDFPFGKPLLKPKLNVLIHLASCFNFFKKKYLNQKVLTLLRSQGVYNYP